MSRIRFLVSCNLFVRLLASGLLVGGLTFAGLYLYSGTYGLNVVLRRGGTVWVSVGADSPRLSPSMRLALRDPYGAVEAGPFAWLSIEPGFDVAELPVIAAGARVDSILLTRVDPARFRLVARNVPAGRELGEWMETLGAALVINGSYYSRYGTPDTPFVSAGVLSGPPQYDARHGAFVASAASTRVHDLANEDWRAALRGAEDAMVSYPLLVTQDGANRVTGDWRWLANRSFVGQDGAGRVILGTTTDAFFSLERLGRFLGAAPLGLTIALNLDGGPVACQGIALKDYRREFCGRWELAAHDRQLKLLTPVFGTGRWAMPIVLAVLPK
jgi:hypothetical protein